jgi:hypothetical protein
MSSTEYEVVWPRSPRTIKINPVAKRLDTLRGKTIAQLWDYIFRGDEIFPILEEELGKRFPDTRFINYSVFGSTHGDKEREVVGSIPAKLKQYRADAVISGGVLRELYARRVAGKCRSRNCRCTNGFARM